MRAKFRRYALYFFTSIMLASSCIDSTLVNASEDVPISISFETHDSQYHYFSKECHYVHQGAKKLHTFMVVKVDDPDSKFPLHTDSGVNQIVGRAKSEVERICPEMLSRATFTIHIARNPRGILLKDPAQFSGSGNVFSPSLVCVTTRNANAFCDKLYSNDIKDWFYRAEERHKREEASLVYERERQKKEQEQQQALQRAQRELEADLRRVLDNRALPFKNIADLLAFDQMATIKELSRKRDIELIIRDIQFRGRQVLLIGSHSQTRSFTKQTQSIGSVEVICEADLDKLKDINKGSTVRASAELLEMTESKLRLSCNNIQRP